MGACRNEWSAPAHSRSSRRRWLRPCESGCPGQARTSAGRTLSLRVQRRSRVARLPLLAPENKEPCNDDDCRATECEGIGDISEHQKAEHDRPEDDSVLIRHDDACGRELERAV